MAKAQILSWSGSLIVNDIKGDLYEETAGFKRTTSDVFVFDTRGIGNRFDPLHGRQSEDELRAMAEYLLVEPNEGHGLILHKSKNFEPPASLSRFLRGHVEPEKLRAKVG